MATAREKRNVLVLGLCQVMFNTGRGLTFLVATIAGATMLGDDLTFVTAPITAMLIGTAAATLPAAHLMRRMGRKGGFVIGSALGTAGGLTAMYGLVLQSFLVFNLGILMFGLYSGFAQQYRFAAADAASPGFKAKAISLVLAAGVIGAFSGPYSAVLGKDLVGATDFVGSFALLTVFTVASGIAVLWIDIPKLTKAEYDDPGRPLGVIFRSPTVVVAVITATLGYVVMNYLMTVTPVTMVNGFSYRDGDVAFVISWHIVGMFAPGFITGSLIQRFGTLKMIGAGNALLLAAVVMALSGTEIWQFWVSLFLLGIGWNFAFTAGTTLLTEVDTPSERAKIQGTNDFIVFTCLAVSSLGSGTVYHLLGWDWVNLTALPMIVIPLIAVAWLANYRRREAALKTARQPAE